MWTGGDLNPSPAMPRFLSCLEAPLLNRAVVEEYFKYRTSKNQIPEIGILDKKVHNRLPEVQQP